MESKESPEKSTFVEKPLNKGKKVRMFLQNVKMALHHIAKMKFFSK
jgi:hypothetical protein